MRSPVWAKSMPQCHVGGELLYADQSVSSRAATENPRHGKRLRTERVRFLQNVIFAVRWPKSIDSCCDGKSASWEAAEI